MKVFFKNTKKVLFGIFALSLMPSVFAQYLEMNAPEMNSTPSGGALTVVLKPLVRQGFVVDLTINCPNETDYVVCQGSTFNEYGVLTTYTTQGSCKDFVYTSQVTARSSGCIIGRKYNFNVMCMNTNTHTSTEWANPNAGQRASFVCEK